MKHKGMSLTLVFCFCVLILPIVSPVTVSFDSSLSDEFAGPFPQWLNIKTNFSAVGADPLCVKYIKLLHRLVIQVMVWQTILQHSWQPFHL